MRVTHMEKKKYSRNTARPIPWFTKLGEVFRLQTKIISAIDVGQGAGTFIPISRTPYAGKQTTGDIRVGCGVHGSQNGAKYGHACALER